MQMVSSFDEFIGNDGQSWNEGLPDSKTKDISLTMCSITYMIIPAGLFMTS